MSLTYLNHIKGSCDWGCKNLILSSSINIQAEDGTNFVPIAVPEICFLTSPSNSKLFSKTKRTT